MGDVVLMYVWHEVIPSYRWVCVDLILVEVEHCMEPLGYRSILDNSILPLVPLSGPDVRGEVDYVRVPPHESSFDGYLNRVPWVYQPQKIREGDVASSSGKVVDEDMAVAIVAVVPHGTIGQGHIKQVVSSLSSVLLHHGPGLSTSRGANEEVHLSGLTTLWAVHRSDCVIEPPVLGHTLGILIDEVSLTLAFFYRVLELHKVVPRPLGSDLWGPVLKGNRSLHSGVFFLAIVDGLLLAPLTIKARCSWGVQQCSGLVVRFPVLELYIALPMEGACLSALVLVHQISHGGGVEGGLLHYPLRCWRVVPCKADVETSVWHILLLVFLL